MRCDWSSSDGTGEEYSIVCQDCLYCDHHKSRIPIWHCNPNDRSSSMLLVALHFLQSACGQPFSASEAHLPDTQLWHFLHKGRETSRRARRGDLPAIAVVPDLPA